MRDREKERWELDILQIQSLAPGEMSATLVISGLRYAEIKKYRDRQREIGRGREKEREREREEEEEEERSDKEEEIGKDR